MPLIATREQPGLLSLRLLSEVPPDWLMTCPSLQEGKPCGGERLLLMFDRWRKLLKAFHNEKKRQFDISKVGLSFLVAEQFFYKYVTGAALVAAMVLHLGTRHIACLLERQVSIIRM